MIHTDYKRYNPTSETPFAQRFLHVTNALVLGPDLVDFS